MCGIGYLPSICPRADPKLHLAQCASAIITTARVDRTEYSDPSPRSCRTPCDTTRIYFQKIPFFQPLQCQ